MIPTTPKKINQNILKLIEKIPAPGEPIFLDLVKFPNAITGDCFGNVDKKIKKDNGTTQHGWIIWEAENYMVEAEFHAVWQDPDGGLHDITPKADGETTILFVPDNETIYTKHYVDNIRLPLCKEAENIASASSALTQLKELHNDGTGKAVLPFGGGISPIKAAPKTGRNDPCPCGSGKKFKKCCL